MHQKRDLSRYGHKYSVQEQYGYLRDYLAWQDENGFALGVHSYLKAVDQPANYPTANSFYNWLKEWGLSSNDPDRVFASDWERRKRRQFLADDKATLIAAQQAFHDFDKPPKIPKPVREKRIDTRTLSTRVSRLENQLAEGLQELAEKQFHAEVKMRAVEARMAQGDDRIEATAKHLADRLDRAADAFAELVQRMDQIEETLSALHLRLAQTA